MVIGGNHLSGRHDRRQIAHQIGIIGVDSRPSREVVRHEQADQMAYRAPDPELTGWIIVLADHAITTARPKPETVSGHAEKPPPDAHDPTFPVPLGPNRSQDPTRFRLFQRHPDAIIMEMAADPEQPPT